jgi:hypothetical protein
MSDYNLEGPKWENKNPNVPDPTVTWSIADTNYSDSPLNFASFLPSYFESILQAAFNKWSSVADITFQEVPDSDNSDIRFGFEPIDGVDNIVGLTQYDDKQDQFGGLAMQKTAIEFDSDENWVQAGNKVVSGDGLNLYPVALHEIGHAIGLAHYFDAPAIMNPVIDVADLTQSDIDGIQALYGRPGSVSSDLAVAIDPGVVFTSRTGAVLTGTVSDSAAVANVEIFDGSTDLGAATLNGDGTWSLAATLRSGTHDLSVVATDASGASATAIAPFFLRTGITGQPYTTEEDDFDAQGNFTAEIFTKGGLVYKSGTVTTLVNGNQLVDYNAGSYFDAQTFYEETNLFDSSKDLLVDTQYNNDGSHAIIGNADGLQLKSLGTDTMTGGGASETFVFTQSPGSETITDFAAKGAGHDVISLAKADFSSIAQILQNTHEQGNDAVINLGQGSSVTIDNVTVATLKAHQHDFKLHA